MQDGDVRLFNTVDGGEIIVENGLFEMTGGLETSVYLSLFGGNEEDDGLEENSFQWWGNIDETEPEKIYRSETQYLLRSIPATSANLLRINDAVERDLQWLLDANIANTLQIDISIPSLNQILIVINIGAFGEESKFEFTENWKVDL